MNFVLLLPYSIVITLGMLLALLLRCNLRYRRALVALGSARGQTLQDQSSVVAGHYALANSWQKQYIQHVGNLLHAQHDQQGQINTALTDHLGCLMVSLQMHMGRLEKAQHLEAAKESGVLARKHMEEAAEQLQGVIRQLGQCQTVNGVEVGAIGQRFDLLAALKNMKHCTCQGVALECLAHSLPILPELLALEAYGIINCHLQHALQQRQGTEFTVQVFGVQGQLAILVEDNGHPLRLQVPSHAVHSQWLKASVGAMSATYALDSGGAGTTLSIEIPFPTLALSA